MAMAQRDTVARPDYRLVFDPELTQNKKEKKKYQFFSVLEVITTFNLLVNVIRYQLRLLIPVKHCKERP
jgi:hypothetical protein